MTKGNPNIKDYGFKKGQSGNPGGRPKGIAALAREHKDKALEVLVAGMDHIDAKVRITAAKEILDRGYGKPLTMTADVSDSLNELDDDTLDAAINALAALGIGAEEVNTGKAKKGKATKH